MTQTPAYKTTVRQFQQTPVLNAAANDFVNSNGVRVSTPLYIDLTIQQRKELLNHVRNAQRVTAQVKASDSHTGLTVETSSSNTSNVESYLGMNLDVLRAALFSRGGVPIDLCLKLQSVTGIEFLSAKDISTAFKAKEKQVKDWITNYSYESLQATEASK